MVQNNKEERGFVLVASLVMLMILTIMSVGLYFRSVVNQQSSAASRDTTQAYYFAETALNYVSWSLFYDPDNANGTVAAYNNKADLDSFDPVSPANSNTLGDRAELLNKPDDPTFQLKYFDNGTIIVSGVAVDNGVGGIAIDYDVTRTPPYSSGNSAPTLSTLPLSSTLLHLALEISATGGVVIDVDADNNGTNDWQAIPTNGAVVWLTAAATDTPGIDAKVAAGSAPYFAGEQYKLIAYAVGYVNGKPLRMLRTVIGEIGAASPTDLGTVTNAPF